MLEVDRIDKTVTAIGYEEELDDEKKEYLLSLVNAVPAVNKAEGILPAENLRYYVNTTSRGMKIAFLDKEYEDASLRDLMKNSLWIVSLSLCGFLVISLIMTKIATAPVEKSWKQQKQLVADMSHELKTPLTVISANTDIVLANRDSTVAEQEKWLVYIRQETARMTKHINEMLYLATVSSTHLRRRLAAQYLLGALGLRQRRLRRHGHARGGNGRNRRDSRHLGAAAARFLRHDPRAAAPQGKSGAAGPVAPGRAGAPRRRRRADSRLDVYKRQVHHLIRLHFAKKDETLYEALDRLSGLRRKLKPQK